MTEGKVITCRAAVCWAAGEPLKIEQIQVDPPKKGEVRVKIVATGLCYSDVSGKAGRALNVIFPAILGHEGSGIVESVGEDVTNFKAGDHIIPLFLPQCKECKVCKHETANACLKFLGMQSKGLQSDGTSRFSCNGKTLYTFLGCSTFSEFTVLPEYNVTKVNPKAPLDKVCLFSCGVSTGYGSALNTAKVKPGSSCAVWGLGALGLAAILGCKNSGATRIIGVDINPDKFEIAKKFGATEFVNPKEITKPVNEYLMEITQGGVDYTFECVGSIATMKQALESTAFGYGVCVLLGVSPSKQELGLEPFKMQMGRTLKGTLFGCYKSVDGIPKLVEEYMEGKLDIDGFITHNLPFEQINDAFDLLRDGKSIRTVLHY